ncbi:MAG: RdgB/HAM1 family non-canonical purine NTP pyrophosphatase [Deltaproteobacteria bacterium]|nr:RdgB/HAM1 family non-canonical purine NTP pyrophosphatase [Deltaproteobacteria bacterium]
MRSLRVGTTNPGKLEELRQLLAPAGYTVRGIDDLEGFAVIEDGATFAVNAVKKAEAVVAATGEAAVADDSGLVVDALNGAPGVHSARYAGVVGPGQDAANRRKLLEALAGVAPDRRSARFVCALAYCRPGEAPHVVTKTVEGAIGFEERGHNGFGYDSLFILSAYGRTAAEVSAEEKHRVSHRGQAIRALAEFLAGLERS